MLEPADRQLLVDALRPPVGCELVHAVGTTYSLDLQALLFAPLSFAMFDWALDDDGTPNPLALLESLRRYADRTTVFCQAGQIGLPRDYQPMLTYLEPAVVPVTAADPAHIFHPKVWVLRFRPADGGRDRYRLICLTRNLTFDRSWDTACVLEGARRAGNHTIGQNQPLVAFLRTLLRIDRLDPARRDAIDHLAEDIADVRFAAPEGFDSVRFHPLGLAPGSRLWRGQPQRVLVMSPFLTAGALRRLRGTAGDDVLISRPEVLDALPPDALDAYGAHVYCLSDAAQPDSDAAGRDTALAATDEMRGDAVDAELQGLHAKLIVAEYAEHVRFYTGSANATDAAFGGNVEFLVELRTNQPGVTIGGLLAQTAGATTTLRDLIEPYTVAGQGPAEPTDGDAVSRALDVARRTVGALAFTATLAERDDGQFQLDLRGIGPLRLPPEVQRMRCWRISAGDAHDVTPDLDARGLTAAFGLVARAGITSFFAFALEARRGRASDTVRFVVNAELVGAPENRADEVITSILRDRQDVLRYLLFLLADPDQDQAALIDALGGGAGVGVDGHGAFDAPVFETLLRALACNPGKLDHIARLLADIRMSGREGELLPEGLDALWQPIWEVRKELGS